MIISIRKKAQEVSFVLLRIAGYIRHKELAARLESISYQLIETLYSDDLNTAMAKVDAAIGLSSLASNIGEINSNNTAIILRELENLKNGLSQYQQTRQVQQMPSVEGLFSKLTISAPAKQNRPAPVPPPMLKSVILSSSEESKKDRSFVKTQDDKPQNKISSRDIIIGESDNLVIMRQNSILARIRQSNGAKLQLKDIIAAFPDISDRTLRYDLVRLCQIGKLHREGSGGPSNFYVVSNAVAAPVIMSNSSHNDGVMNNSPMSL